MAAVIGIISGNFLLTGGVVDSPNAYFDDSSHRSEGGGREHVALGSVSDNSANPSEDALENPPANTITIILTAPSTRSLTPPPDYTTATTSAKTITL